MKKRFIILRWYYFTHLIGMILASVLIFIAMLVPESMNFQKADAWVMALFLFIALCGTYMFIRMPQSIEIADDDSIKFESFLGISYEKPEKLIEIKRESMGYYVVFQFNNRKYKVLNNINGFYELLSYLKERHPDVKIRGL